MDYEGNRFISYLLDYEENRFISYLVNYEENRFISLVSAKYTDITTLLRREHEHTQSLSLL